MKRKLCFDKAMGLEQLVKMSMDTLGKELHRIALKSLPKKAKPTSKAKR